MSKPETPETTDAAIMEAFKRSLDAHPNAPKAEAPPCACLSRVLDDGLPATSHRVSCSKHPFQAEALPTPKEQPRDEACMVCGLIGKNAHTEAYHKVLKAHYTETPASPAPVSEPPIEPPQTNEEIIDRWLSEAETLAMESYGPPNLDEAAKDAANTVINFEPQDCDEDDLNAARAFLALKAQSEAQAQVGIDLVRERDALKAQNATLTAERDALKAQLTEVGIVPYLDRMTEIAKRHCRAAEITLNAVADSIRAAREAGKPA